MSEETPVLSGNNRFLVVRFRSTTRNDICRVFSPMRLQSQIVIRRSPEDVGRFLGDISNISKWDRGVGEAKPNSNTPLQVGSEFETIAPAGLGGNTSHRGRMGYRIAEIGNDYCKVQLTNADGNARLFKTAEWMFRAEPAGENTLLTCSVNFVLRVRYFVLAPIFWMMRGAIRRDLQQLKSVLEKDTSSSE